MATRISPSFAPKGDEFTAFAAELEAEMGRDGQHHNGHWLSNAAKYLFSSQRNDNSSNGMSDHQFHELMVSSLSEMGNENTVGAMIDVPKENKQKVKEQQVGDRIEHYIAAYLPTHLIRAKMLKSASNVLTDEDFIARRVSALGTVESSRRQVDDLLDLRREIQRAPCNIDILSLVNDGSSSMVSMPSPDRNNVLKSYASTESSNVVVSSMHENQKDSIDINVIQREGSRLVIDEVYRVVDMSSNSADSLSMAICLSTIGEGLLKARQARDAMLRLEEAVGIYRGLLGPYHVDVARALNSVAKALVKLGEKRVALLKFGEASRIFESCNANRHYDSIANVQTMASLLFELGDWAKAKTKYEDVIALKISVYGTNSLPVARTVNEYAVGLAKYGHMDESLYQYEVARGIYEVLLSTGKTQSLYLFLSLYSQDSSNKFSLDMTLIDLNIASIKSKKGDFNGALYSYERGVIGLRLHLAKSNQDYNEGMETSKLISQKRHLVSAIGRIGSLKMKVKDNAGALQAYLTLIKEVSNTSPTSSRTEKAKAHVKCATIYRQMGNTQDNKNAVNQLRDALQMYTQLHGSSHKDTKAIASSLQQWQEQDALISSSFETTLVHET